MTFLQDFKNAFAPIYQGNQRLREALSQVSDISEPAHIYPFIFSSLDQDEFAAALAEVTYDLDRMSL